MVNVEQSKVEKLRQFEQIVKAEFDSYKFAHEKADGGKIMLRRLAESSFCGGLCSVSTHIFYLEVLKKKKSFFSRAQRIARIECPLSTIGPANYLLTESEIEIDVYSLDFLPYAESIGREYESREIGTAKIITHF